MLTYKLDRQSSKIKRICQSNTPKYIGIGLTISINQLHISVQIPKEYRSWTDNLYKSTAYISPNPK